MVAGIGSIIFVFIAGGVIGAWIGLKIKKDIDVEDCLKFLKEKGYTVRLYVAGKQ